MLWYILYTPQLVQVETVTSAGLVVQGVGEGGRKERAAVGRREGVREAWTTRPPRRGLSFRRKELGHRI